MQKYTGKTQLTVGGVMVKDHKVLLVLHGKLNKWLFPGGHMEPNETPDQAVIREVKEETGLDFKLIEFGPIEGSPDVIERLALPFHANIHNVGDHDHYCSYYLGTVDSTETKISSESRELRWVGLDELDQMQDMPENIKRITRYVLGANLRK